ncbi:MAG TPA: porin family protein [Flavisolibacter sp.]|nr:porin family protein [Flavisolibacter sp.]
MKKISVFALALAASVVVVAQETHQQLRTPRTNKVQFGLDVGVNLARLDANEGDFASGTAPSTNNKTAFHVGTFVNIPIGGMVSLKPQLIYSKQGSKLRIGSTDFEEDLDYIYVAPAALHVMTKGGFIIETGPMLGYLLSGSRENTTANTSVDVKDARKDLDFMWSGGIGYLSRIGLGAHVRYNHGFSNVLNTDDDALQSPGKLQNRVFQIGLMYHFGGHK